MRVSSRVGLAAGAAVVVVLAAFALRPRPAVVETATVSRGSFEMVVADDGRTRVRDRFVISAPLAGRVSRITLKAGDAVKSGQVVAILAPGAPAFIDARAARELEQRVGATEAQYARARAETARNAAQRDQARVDQQRQVRLAQSGFVSATSREQSELALRAAERSLEAATFAEDAALHEYQQARAALSRYKAESGSPASQSATWEVRSPVSGRILRVAQESEAMVAQGATLLEVADSRSLEAVVDVLSQESVAIRPGMPARIELGQGVAPLKARVRLVEPSAFTKVSALGVEEQRVNVVLDIDEPLDRIVTIGDGFRVDAAIVTQAVDDALQVPVGALFRDGRGWAVYLVEDGRARKRTVETPQRNGRQAVVTAGVKPGETVIVYPPDTLADGARVEMRPGS